MKYKDFYNNLFNERYGGSSKEINIWYHGTSSKRLPTILSRGLDPNVPIKNKSWGSDINVSIMNLDKTSYGGIYVTRDISVALRSALRIAAKEKTNRAIVILSLQDRSLIADEDDFSNTIYQLHGVSGISSYQAIYPYMVEMYGINNDYKQEFLDVKEGWCDSIIDDFFEYIDKNNKKNTNLNLKKLKKQVYNLLYDYGYKAVLTRMVSHISKKDDFTSYWHWRKVYAEIHGLKNYGEEFNIPDPPTPIEGENIFRSFVDKLTRTMKHIIRYYDSFAYKTARSLNPIKFSGTNKIIGIVELIKKDDIFYHKLIYGQIPEDYKKQWNSRYGDNKFLII